MTRLRKMMLEELERRNYSQGTRRIYRLQQCLGTGAIPNFGHVLCAEDRW